MTEKHKATDPNRDGSAEHNYLIPVEEEDRHRIRKNAYHVLRNADNGLFKDKPIDVTRLEIIKNGARMYVNNDCKIELSYQDGSRTLKIFVESLG